jgi:hypothetical protein
VNRRRNPEKRRGIGISALGESEFSRSRESGHPKSRNNGKIRAIHWWRHVAKIERSSAYWLSGNRSSQGRRKRDIESLEILEESGPSIWKDAWQLSMSSGKSRQGSIHRCLVHRDIGDPGDKLFVHFGIAKRDTPMSGSQLSSQQRKRTVSS